MIDKRHITQFILGGIALVLCLGCRKAESDPIGYSLSFTASALEMKSSGSTITDTDNLTSSPFGVSGIWTESEGGSDNVNVFNGDRVKVSYNTSWEYSPLAYWRINKWYRFRAYHPYESPALSVQNASGDKLTIEYSTVAGQSDLLVGFKSLQANTSNIINRVPIEFKHVLSGLKFKIAFKNVSEISDGYTDYVTSFYMSGLSPMGTMIYSHKDDKPLEEDLRWLPSFYDDTEFYTWNGSKLFYKINNEGTNATIIYENNDGKDGLIFVIPQECSRSDEEPTMVHFKTSRGGEAIHSAKLPKIEWKPGYIYVYTLLINKSDVTVLVSIKPWTEVESNETIYL